MLKTSELKKLGIDVKISNFNKYSTIYCRNGKGITISYKGIGQLI